jgi:hypothetical protein
MYETMAELTQAEMDALVEEYKEGIDRTLIRENLRLTPHERLVRLDELYRFAAEVRAAGERARRK